MLLESLAFAIDVTLPISLIIFLGAFLKRIDWINDEFSLVGSRLVFNVTLPCLLFFNVAKTNLQADFPIVLIAYSALATTVIFSLFHYCAGFLQPAASRGAFVQGACRGNMAIVGLAFCVNAFGESVLPLSAMYLSVIVILYNVYSILTLYYHRDEKPRWQTVTKSVFTNPLAIAIILGLLVSALQVPLPRLLVDTGSYIAAMTLPLALLCAGASIRLQEFRTSILLYYAVAFKIIIIPLVVTFIGYLLGLSGEQLGVLYLMTAAPTAAAAYPMVRAIGGDYHLTAAIIAGTTILSMLTTTIGLFLLRYLQWV